MEDIKKAQSFNELGEKIAELVGRGRRVNLNDLAEEIHLNAVDHGWWDEERSFGDIIALCHSELSEALEEYRTGRSLFWYKTPNPVSAAMGNADYDIMHDPNCWKGEKPEGVAIEMIDCLIRILDWCGQKGVDIDTLLYIKHTYNKSRPYRHGGKVL